MAKGILLFSIFDESNHTINYYFGIMDGCMLLCIIILYLLSTRQIIFHATPDVMKDFLISFSFPLTSAEGEGQTKGQKDRQKD